MIKYFLLQDIPPLTRGSENAAGWDVRAANSTPREMAPGERWLVSTELFMSMPAGICAMVCSRSGLAINHGVVVLNAPGIIDADYRGEVKVSLINLSSTPHIVLPGDKIAQLLFIPVYPCGDEGVDARWIPTRVKTKDELGTTDRGAGGHGSTGR